MAGWSKYFFLIWMCSAFLLPARILFAQIPALEFHGSSILENPPVDTAGFPAVFDLRDHGRIGEAFEHPVSGCWAAAAVGSLGSVFLSEGYGFPPLSVSHLQNCHGFVPSRSYNGNHYMATAYFVRGSGPVAKGQGSDTLCEGEFTSPVLVTEAVCLPPDPAAIKRSVLERGGVYAMMYFRKEHGWDSVSNLYYTSATKKINHAVVITGWNDTLSVPGGHGAWIARNSLGKGFGDDGFFYISYLDKNFLDYNAIWTEWMDRRDDLRVHYYDTLGSYYSFGFEDSVCCGLVRFTAGKDCRLAMVGTFVNNANSSVRAGVYSRFDTATGNLSDLRYASGVRSFPYRGYFTFRLDVTVEIKAGEEFFVMVKYVSPGTDQPMPVETYIEDYSDPHITSKTSWVNPDIDRWPATWYECGAESPWENLMFDLCIKAYCVESMK